MMPPKSLPDGNTEDDDQPSVTLNWHYSAVPEWVLDHPDLNADAVRVFGSIARFANVKAYPRIDWIAERCHCSPDTVRRAIKALEKVGALRITRRFTNGRQTSNGYDVAAQFPFSTSQSAYPPSPPSDPSALAAQRGEDVDKDLDVDKKPFTSPTAQQSEDPVDKEQVREAIAEAKRRLPRGEQEIIPGTATTSLAIDDHPYVDTTGKQKCDVCSFGAWLHVPLIVPAPSPEPPVGEDPPASPSTATDGTTSTSAEHSEGGSAPVRLPEACPECAEFGPMPGCHSCGGKGWYLP